MSSESLEEYVLKRFSEIPGFLGLVVYNPEKREVAFHTLRSAKDDRHVQEFLNTSTSTGEYLHQLYQNFTSFSAWNMITLHSESRVCTVYRNSHSPSFVLIYLDKDPETLQLAGFLLPQLVEELFERLKER